MNKSDEAAFLEASRHVPKILRHQILCHLTSSYLKSEKEDNENDSILTSPSIERFYGAVLFVDISGFTALSLKLDVESLKNHINDYFSKMLAVIEKWNGDVIKFAGDALYIVWPVQLSELSAEVASRSKSMESLFAETQFLEAARVAVDKAINCALEINCCCCHHKIIIGESVNPSKQRWTKLFNTLPSLLPPGNASTSTDTISEGEVVYLNVHSGIGFGLMAGVDIGANDRWEFFLLGDPLTQSANAESKASTGDLVASDIAHSLFHFDKYSKEHYTGSADQSSSCNCCLLDEGYFRINSEPRSAPEKKNFNPLPTAERPLNQFHLNAKKNNQLEVLKLLNQRDDFCMKDTRHSEELKEEVQILFLNLFPTFQSRMITFLNDYQIDISNDLLDFEEDGEEVVQVLAAGPIKEEEDEDDFETTERRGQLISIQTRGELFESPRNERGYSKSASHDLVETKVSLSPCTERIKMKKLVLHYIDRKLKPAFIQWLLKCLLDDILRHTHEAPRKRYEYSQLRRTSVFNDFLNACFFFQSPILQTLQQLGELRRYNSQTIETSSLLSIPRNWTRQITKTLKGFVNDVGLSAELRTVTVMFINIDGLDAELMVNDSEVELLDAFKSDKRQQSLQHGGYSAFNFIRRSRTEEQADLLLLSQLQNCIEAICSALLDNGGQLRQFIMDDKGTVCIGTFGLRGSMAVDNAASAIECAKTIIAELNQINLQASIGITTGKGYCGIVGSKFRHEYAVMGPSTNLSARLMGKAGMNQILCDTETRNRDRTHRFEPLGAIKAKGYSDLVQTFLPIFDDPSANKDTAASKHSERLSSFDSVMIRNFISQDKASGIRKKSRFLENLKASNENSPFLNPQELQQTEFSEELRNELINATLTVHKRRGSREFYVNNDGINKQTTSPVSTVISKIYGRRKEIEEICQFLLLPFCSSPSATRISNKFDVTLPSRLLAVSGKEGFGKSSLVTGIATKVSMMSQMDSSCNITVIKNRTNTVVFTSPFQAIKSILQEILKKYSKLFVANDKTMGTSLLPNNTQSTQKTPLHRDSSSSLSPKPKSNNREKSLSPLNLKVGLNRDQSSSLQLGTSGKWSPFNWSLTKGPLNRDQSSQLQGNNNSVGQSISGQKSNSLHNADDELNLVERQIKNGLQLISGRLAPEHLILLPLLSFYQIVKNISDNEYTSSLTGKAKLFGTLDLICAIIDLYSKITGKALFFVCEKLHLFDSWSLLCLNQVWRHSKGVMILCTYSLMVKQLAAVTTRVTNHRRSSAYLSFAGLQSTGNESETTGFDEDAFFRLYETDVTRFKRLALQLLDKGSIQSIARDTIANFGEFAESSTKVAICSGALEDKVFEMSGGNPLYATAIVSAVNLSELKKLPSENKAVITKQTNGKLMTETSTLDKILSDATRLIGEVICYRFDQLDTLAQVILKTASVICSTQQSSFTLDTLLFLLSDEVAASSNVGSPSSTSRDEIINCLRMLVQNDEFLQLLDFITDEEDEETNDNHDPPLSPAPSPTMMITEQMIVKGRFSFRVILEQMTIYDLLIDEQKIKIHECVAFYYHLLNSDAKTTGTSSFNANLDSILFEAFHWRYAKYHAYALLSHYQAAGLYREQGDYEKMKLQLKIADELYAVIRAESGLFPIQIEFSIEDLITIYESYDSDATPKTEMISSEPPHLRAQGSTFHALSKSLASGSDEIYDHNMIDKTKYLNSSSISRSVLIPEIGTTPSLTVNSETVKPSEHSELFYSGRNAALLFDMCLGEGEILTAIISTQIMIAQNYCMSFENPMVVLTTLEDCLVLLLLYHKFVLMNLPDMKAANRPFPSNNPEFSTMESDGGTTLTNLPVDQETLAYFLVESFEAFLSQVYGLCIWLILQSPLGFNDANSSNRLRKAWFLCDRLLALVSQPSTLSDQVKVRSASIPPVVMVGNTSAKYNKNSIQHQQSKRALSQRFPSFKASPIPSQTVSPLLQQSSLLIKSHAPSFLSPPESESKQRPPQKVPLVASNNTLRTKQKAHSVHSTCLYILLLLRDGQLSKAVKKCDRVLVSYSIRKYSKTLIELYGYDITQYTMTMLCQELLLVGEIEKCFNYFTIIFENIYHLKDYYSIFLAYLPLFSVCVALRKFSDAKKVLLLVEEYEKQTFHVQVFHPLIKMEMKYFLTMAMILWDDDDRDQADEEQQPKQRDQEVNYYHRFLSNTFAKSSDDEPQLGLMSLSTKQRMRFDELVLIHDQNELQNGTISLQINSENAPPTMKSTTLLHGKALNELKQEEIEALFEKNEHHQQQYFVYFLYQQGCAIESILACVKLFQYFAQHQNEASSSSLQPFQEALIIFEQQYHGLIRLKSKFISQQSNNHQPPRCNIYSELNSFSLLLSLYQDLQKQLAAPHTENNTIMMESLSSSALLPSQQVEESTMEVSLKTLQEIEQLLVQSEKCSYSLPLTIFSEFLRTIPRYQTENNPTPSSTSSMNHYQELAQRMKEKGYSDIQQNHNSSQLKGFEYLISRMSNTFV